MHWKRVDWLTALLNYLYCAFYRGAHSTGTRPSYSTGMRCIATCPPIVGA